MYPLRCEYQPLKTDLSIDNLSKLQITVNPLHTKLPLSMKSTLSRRGPDIVGSFVYLRQSLQVDNGPKF